MVRKRISTIVALALLVAVLSSSLAGPVWGQQPQRVKVLIGFRRQPGRAEQGLVHASGGTIKYTYHLVPAIAATLPEPAIAALQANPNVTHVDLDGQVWAVDAELDKAWGVKRIGAGAVHPYNDGTGVKVAVIDSGIDYTHADLNQNYAGGWDFVNGDNDPGNPTHDGPMDDYGHGTHVAGTIAAEDNEAGVVGVAPGASLYGLKVLNANGSGYWSDIIAAIQWCAVNDIQVANLSLGSSSNPGVDAQMACDNANAAGVVIVAAAGNSGNRPGRGDNVIYPARYDSVIAVAATDSNDNRASFSSTGDQVELAAPGVAVFSTWNDGDSPHDPQPELYDGDYYKYGSGTSMASPHVAGVAALVIATGITDANGDGYINDEVRQRLIQTADDLGSAGRDTKYGFGLVDADEAAGEVNDPPTVLITNPADDSTFDSGASISFEGTASDAEDGDLTASLSWTSSIDGPIGTGGSFSSVLEDGDHTITASVTDTGGKTGSTSISITVGTPSEPTMFVYAIDMSSKRAGINRSATAVVTIHDANDSPVEVEGATVYGTWSGGYSGSVSGITGSDGTVSFTSGRVKAGATFTFTVDDVQKDGYVYDYSLNNETSDFIVVP